METKTNRMENHSPLTGREILIALAVKYEGDWNKIYADVSNHETDDLAQYLENIDTNNVITLLDADYPQILKEIYNPPFVLLIKGDRSLLQSPNQIASVIGTRKPTRSGEQAIKTIVNNQLKDKIICVGASKGTSELVLDSCFLNNQKTIIVLPCGFDNIYPQGYDTYIAKALDIGACIVTEYPNQTQVAKNNFPKSGRIIAGLCQHLVAMEIQKQSGSQIALGFGLSFNRDIYVLPVAFDSEFSNNTLIRDGATPIIKDEDFLDSNPTRYFDN